MKQGRFSEEQIVSILKEAEAGTSKVADLCRRHGISDATFYHWRSKYGGLEISELRRLRQRVVQSQTVMMAGRSGRFPCLLGNTKHSDFLPPSALLRFLRFAVPPVRLGFRSRSRKTQQLRAWSCSPESPNRIH
jgi:putative transposase